MSKISAKVFLGWVHASLSRSKGPKTKVKRSLEFKFQEARQEYGHVTTGQWQVNTVATIMYTTPLKQSDSEAPLPVQITLSQDSITTRPIQGQDASQLPNNSPNHTSADPILRSMRLFTNFNN
jgi:hypothetical protein